MRVSRIDRENMTKQTTCVFWFTGFSGSGKTTLALEVEKALYECGYLTYLLDGDEIRNGLNSDLGFDDKSRKEAVRRIAEVTKIILDCGIIPIVSFISPFREERDFARQLVGDEKFLEIFLDCPFNVCEARDTKGLYERARSGEIKNFTGIDSPYEMPLKPDVILDTSELSIEECGRLIVAASLIKLNHNL